MAFDPYEDISRGRARVEQARSGALKIVVLFSVAAIVIALIGTSMLEGRLGKQTAGADASFGLDYTATGTVAKGERYTVRRSVLQPTPRSICILRENGTRSGDC
jgi:hypothetical protein